MPEVFYIKERVEFLFPKDGILLGNVFFLTLAHKRGSKKITPTFWKPYNLYETLFGYLRIGDLLRQKKNMWSFLRSYRFPRNVYGEL